MAREQVVSKPRLDALTRQLLAEAVAGCKASAWVLEDRLDELGLDGALEAWRWARAQGKRPWDNYQVWWWYKASGSYMDSNTLPGSWSVEEYGCVDFESREEAWEWLLLEWGTWNTWTR